MTLLAALSVGVFCYFLVGALSGRTPRIGSWKRSRPAVSAQQLWLTQAGVRLAPWQFWCMSLLLGAAAFVAAWVVTRTPLIAVVPAAVVALLPRAFYAQRRATRLRSVQEAWPDGLRDLVASIAAGRSLTQALHSLASSGPAPLRVAFARVSRRSHACSAPPARSKSSRRSSPTRRATACIEVLVLAHERGGQIVKEILEDLVVVTTKDLKVLDEIETEGLEMKINARAVLVLPWFVLLALTMRAGPFRDFYQSAAGLAVVVVGAGLSALGYAWISRLGRMHSEQRVFGSGGVTTGGAIVTPRAGGGLRCAPRRGRRRGARAADRAARAPPAAVHARRPGPPRSYRRPDRRAARRARAGPVRTPARAAAPCGRRTR